MLDHLDYVVNGKEWFPYSGWWRKDYLLPAIQQERGEFYQLLDLLHKYGTKRRFLQLGLGTPGASHVLFNFLAREGCWTVEVSHAVVAQYKERTPFANDRLITAPTCEAVREVSIYGSFDFLFIDASHAYEDVKADYLNYSPMVQIGGIIAFHDAGGIAASVNPEAQGVMKFCQEIGAEVFGEVLGIGYVKKT